MSALHIEDCLICSSYHDGRTNHGLSRYLSEHATLLSGLLPVGLQEWTKGLVLQRQLAQCLKSGGDCILSFSDMRAAAISRTLTALPCRCPSPTVWSNLCKTDSLTTHCADMCYKLSTMFTQPPRYRTLILGNTCL